MAASTPVFSDSASAVDRIRSDSMGLGQRLAIALQEVGGHITSHNNTITIRWTPAHPKATRQPTTGQRPRRETGRGRPSVPREDQPVAHDKKSYRGQVPGSPGTSGPADDINHRGATFAPGYSERGRQWQSATNSSSPDTRRPARIYATRLVRSQATVLVVQERRATV